MWDIADIASSPGERLLLSEPDIPGRIALVARYERGWTVEAEIHTRMLSPRFALFETG